MLTPTILGLVWMTYFLSIGHWTFCSATQHGARSRTFERIERRQRELRESLEEEISRPVRQTWDISPLPYVPPRRTRQTCPSQRTCAKSCETCPPSCPGGCPAPPPPCPVYPPPPPFPEIEEVCTPIVPQLCPALPHPPQITCKKPPLPAHCPVFPPLPACLPIPAPPPLPCPVQPTCPVLPPAPPAVCSSGPGAAQVPATPTVSGSSKKPTKSKQQTIDLGLFSFGGFEDDDDPVEDLEEVYGGKGKGKFKESGEEAALLHQETTVPPVKKTCNADGTDDYGNPC